jgi:hypothetical protein
MNMKVTFLGKCCGVCSKRKTVKSLCLTKRHAMKTYWQCRYRSTHSLISALDGGELSASRPGRFTPRENPRYTFYRRLGGIQSRSGHGDKKKNSQPPPGFVPRSSDCPACSQSLSRLSYPGSCYARS